MVSITDFGAVKGGKELITKPFQAAIDACHAEGGGTVYVPAGLYLMGTVHLYDNIHIVFEPGAKILGSTDLDNDYDQDEEFKFPAYQDVSHSFYHHSLFRADYCSHISITGPGIIDMQGKFEDTRRGNGKFGENCFRGAHVIGFKECYDVLLKDFSIYYATDLAVYLGGCHTVRVIGLFMDTHIDGINPDCCVDTVIADCIIHTGDDGIVPKSSYTLGRKQITENMVITNCVVSSDCSAIKLGTESNGGFRNITISNCTIYNTREAGLSFEIVDGGEINGITVSNISQHNVGCPFVFILGDRRRGPEGTDIGVIKNVNISNLIHTGPYSKWPKVRTVYFVEQNTIGPNQYATLFSGLPEHYIENISLSDINIEVAGGGTKEEGEEIKPEKPQAYPNPQMYGCSNAYGFFMRHVKNINMRNVHVTALEPDFRPKYQLDDVIGLTVSDCDEELNNIK